MYNFQKVVIKNTINSLDIRYFECYHNFMFLNEINYFYVGISMYFNCKLEHFNFKIKKFLLESTNQKHMTSLRRKDL